MGFFFSRKDGKIGKEKKKWRYSEFSSLSAEKELVPANNVHSTVGMKLVAQVLDPLSSKILC